MYNFQINRGSQKRNKEITINLLESRKKKQRKSKASRKHEIGQKANIPVTTHMQVDTHTHTHRLISYGKLFQNMIQKCSKSAKPPCLPALVSHKGPILINLFLAYQKMLKIKRYSKAIPYKKQGQSCVYNINIR